MALPPLRTLLARLEEPVEIDLFRIQVDAARRAVERTRDGLRERVPHRASALAEATDDARTRSADVEQIDQRTRVGAMAKLLSTVSNDAVQEHRARASSSLNGSLALLERRIEDARMLAEQVDGLASDAQYGATILLRLRERAIAAGLGAADVGHIERAAALVAAVPGQVAGLAAPLDAPIRQAVGVAQHAAGVLGRLKSGGRAATVGESLLDGLISPDSGPLGQMARAKVAKAAPGLVPDLDRSEGGDAVLAEIEGQRESARERVRRDAEARRAAEAELDALDWDS